MWPLLGAQFLLAGQTWPVAPEQIPTHWGMDGKVDGFGNRLEGLFLLARRPGALSGVADRAPDRSAREAYPLFAGSYTVLRFAILAVMTAMYGLVHLAIRGYEVEMNRVAPLHWGPLLVIGSQMGRLRPNWFVGVRTP